MTQTDLDTGLFYFGCCKVHVLNPDAEGGPDHNEINWFYGDDPAEGRRVHQMIVAAVEKADAEGRAAWRALDGRNNLHQLNDLLFRNKLKRVRMPRASYGYTYPLVKRLVRESTRPLEVVC